MADDLDLSRAVRYHHGRFPPAGLDSARLLAPLSEAAAALARYDQMLRGLHNSEILLAPMRRQEAVVSSRIEGTITTLDDVLRYEADEPAENSPRAQMVRSETLEVVNYHHAMLEAQRVMRDGAPLSEWLIRAAHRTLLRRARGDDRQPGEYKTAQNYLAGRNRREILFVPAEPERLRDGMEALFRYIRDAGDPPLLKAAISHVEFEALHPFNDGNGRIGRMLITLMLWESDVISKPHFYISEYLEEARDEYIDRMRAVSADDAWTDWCIFFLEAVTEQARRNLDKADRIGRLYEEMKEVFPRTLASAYAIAALDYLFANPVYRNSRFAASAGIPKQTAMRFSRILLEEGLIRTVEPSAGRRAAMYAFEPLLEIVRGE